MLVETAAEWTALGVEGLTLALDTGHCLVTQDIDPAEAVRLYADQVGTVAVEDMRQGVHEHLAFGQGDMDVPSILKAPDEIGFRKLVCVELSRESPRAHLAIPESIRGEVCERLGVAPGRFALVPARWTPRPSIRGRRRARRGRCAYLPRPGGPAKRRVGLHRGVARPGSAGAGLARLDLRRRTWASRRPCRGRRAASARRRTCCDRPRASPVAAPGRCGLLR